MSNLTYRLLGVVIMLVVFYLTARWLVPMAGRADFAPEGWDAVLLGGALLGSPIAGLLLFELFSGRALGPGFSVVRRRDAPRTYWVWVGLHFAMWVVVIAAVAKAYHRAQ